VADPCLNLAEGPWKRFGLRDRERKGKGGEEGGMDVKLVVKVVWGQTPVQ